MANKANKGSVITVESYRKDDTFVTKNLSAIQLEALKSLAASCAAGKTIDVSVGGNKYEKRIGVSGYSIRVSTDRYQRWPSGDRLVSANKNTLKMLSDNGLAIHYGGSYSPDYGITAAGIAAAIVGTYQKRIQGVAIAAVTRPMTDSEQREADIAKLQEAMTYNQQYAEKTAEEIAWRLEELVREIRQSIKDFSPERARARRWGKDETYFSNNIVSRTVQTVASLRFDIVSSAEARLLIAMNLLDGFEIEVAE